MAKTQVADVIVPALFAPYIIQRTAELSVLYSSGIISTDAAFDAMASNGGKTNTMPFWNDIKQASQVMDDTNPLTVNKIAGDSDICVTHNRANAWSVNDLAKYLSGDDPLRAIQELVAAYWARELETILIQLLTGVFAASSMAGNVLDISSRANTGVTLTHSNCFTGQSFIDAKYLLGDNADKLTAIAMHSAIEASLLKQDLIDFIPVSEGKGMIKQFQGLRVIVDDHCPLATGTQQFGSYTSYLFGEGAIAMGNDKRAGDPVEGGFGTWAVELARVALNSDTNLINRRRFIMHPRGVKFTSSSMAGQSPTNAELATAANWSRVYENKNVRLVAFITNAAQTRAQAVA